MLSLTTMIASALHSQIDTVCIYRPDAIRKLKQADEAVLLAEKVTLLNEQIFLLNQRIMEKEQMVAAYQQINTENDSLISSYKKEIQLMQDQRKIFETAIKDKEKEIRRLKRKLFFRTVGEAIVAAVFAYLYFTK